MEMPQDVPVIFFKTANEWEAWLAAHYQQPQGVWVKFAKKHTGITSLTYEPALDAALCYGWIDGQSRSFDEQYYLQKFTPRRPRSIWSKRNVERVGRLIAEGRMQPSGQAATEAAKADGRWEQAYDPPSTVVMPADFQAALDSHPKAKAFYETLNKTNAYAVLWRIQTARRPETRAARITAFITMLEAEKKLH